MLHLFGVFKSDLLKVRSITVDSLLYEHLYNKSHYKVYRFSCHQMLVIFVQQNLI